MLYTVYLPRPGDLRQDWLAAGGTMLIPLERADGPIFGHKKQNPPRWGFLVYEFRPRFLAVVSKTLLHCPFHDRRG